MERTVACLFGVVLLAACDGPRDWSPPAPTPSPAVPIPGGLTGVYALSGVVTAEGFTVAGATVALLAFEDGALIESTLTDGNGSYRLASVRNVSPFSGALVSVSKPEFFTATRYVPMNQDEKSDFDLERARHISVGQRIQSRPSGARCASLGYGGGPGSECQRFALTAPTSGTLEVTVSSSPASPFDATLLKPDGTIGVYVAAPTTPLRLALQVLAGLTYQIDVVPIGGPEFEVTTSMR